jgi:hypothetical protein
VPTARKTGKPKALSNTSRYAISNMSDREKPYVYLYLRNVGVFDAKNRAKTPQYAPKFVGLSARPRPATLQLLKSRAKLESIKAGLAGLGCRSWRPRRPQTWGSWPDRQFDGHPHPGGARSGCSKNIVGRLAGLVVFRPRRIWGLSYDRSTAAFRTRHDRSSFLRAIEHVRSRCRQFNVRQRR